MVRFEVNPDGSGEVGAIAGSACVLRGAGGLLIDLNNGQAEPWAGVGAGVGG